MAVIAVGDLATATPGELDVLGVQLATGLTTAVDTDVAFRGSMYNGGAVVVTNVGTGSPTMTFTIQGSMDGTNFYNVPYALVATPRTFVLTAITTTTSATKVYLLQELVAYQYLKLNFSVVTTQTVDVVAYL